MTVSPWEGIEEATEVIEGLNAKKWFVNIEVNPTGTFPPERVEMRAVRFPGNRTKEMVSLVNAETILGGACKIQEAIQHDEFTVHRYKDDDTVNVSVRGTEVEP